MKFNWKKFFPSIGIIIFIYILLKVNLYEVFNEIINVNIFFILLALLFVILSLFFQTLKWFVIAIKQDIKIPFKEAFKINLMANFYGFITPSKLGTILRAEYLKKYTSNVGRGLCNFILDKILDTSSLFFSAILFSFIFKEKLLNIPINFFIFSFFILILLTFIFVDKKRSKMILQIFYRHFIPESKKEKMRITFDSFYENIPKKRYFILFFLLNLINWMVIYLTAFFVGRAIDIELPFIYFLAILPIGTLISIIPISINGLGTREAALISLFSLFGVSAEKVFSMSMINLFISGIIPAIMAIFLIYKNKQ